MRDLRSLYKRRLIFDLVVFDDVCEHDIEWGERSIPWLEDLDEIDGVYKEWYLSQGLSFLRMCVETKTYNERYRLLNPLFDSDWEFMYAALSERNCFLEVGYPLCALSTDELQDISPALRANVSDFEPLTAWYVELRLHFWGVS